MLLCNLIFRVIIGKSKYFHLKKEKEKNTNKRKVSRIEGITQNSYF